MAALLIGYDLNRPGQNYTALIKEIKDLGSWCHPLESTWVVTTPKTVSQVRDLLRGYVDRNDELLVMNVTGTPWASYNLSSEVAAWLETNI
ncbi:hypothetical protein [Streptomyces aureus]|uniref:hypothetical protein n=1 Tax=Streptomyces aureus TaxID=193461 RepID=UPI000567C50F|nr:hypothetical protein [Streptomyces aureus]